MQNIRIIVAATILLWFVDPQPVDILMAWLESPRTYTVSHHRDGLNPAFEFCVWPGEAPVQHTASSASGAGANVVPDRRMKIAGAIDMNGTIGPKDADRVIVVIGLAGVRHEIEPGQIARVDPILWVDADLSDPKRVATAGPPGLGIRLEWPSDKSIVSMWIHVPDWLPKGTLLYIQGALHWGGTKPRYEVSNLWNAEIL